MAFLSEFLINRLLFPLKILLLGGAWIFRKFIKYCKTDSNHVVRLHSKFAELPANIIHCYIVNIINKNISDNKF